MGRNEKQLDATQETCPVGIRRLGELMVVLLALMFGCTGSDPGSRGTGGIGGGLVACEPACGAVLHEVCDNDAESHSSRDLWPAMRAR
jgi:hypothetical protein